jgi:hypothetical protein
LDVIDMLYKHDVVAAFVIQKAVHVPPTAHGGGEMPGGPVMVERDLLIEDIGLMQDVGIPDLLEGLFAKFSVHG